MLKSSAPSLPKFLQPSGELIAVRYLGTAATTALVIGYLAVPSVGETLKVHDDSLEVLRCLEAWCQSWASWEGLDDATMQLVCFLNIAMY
jgi:hypothetical protein